MSMGRRKIAEPALFVSCAELPRTPGHPFYRKLNELLSKAQFDRHVEELCAPYYSGAAGRPSLPPAVYFRLHFLGYFEKIDSERGIAWKIADSLTLREFLGYSLTQSTPDHSTISRNRRLLPESVHDQVFQFILAQLAKAGLLKGTTLGIDATTLESNAALRSIRSKHDGKSYREYLRELAKEDGIEDPSDDDLARLDRNRKGRSTSNKDWENPHNPEAKITKLKTGQTHFAEKCEHAVDLETGAVVAVSITGANTGDTTSILSTLNHAAVNLAILANDGDLPEDGDPLSTIVADKGYHSNATCSFYQSPDLELKTYFSEPKRGRRKWQGDTLTQKAVYANRRRIKSDRGKVLMKKRGELLERPFAHYLDNGGLRRSHVKGLSNVRKRILNQVAAFNLGLIMRKIFGVGTPRGMTALAALLSLLFGPLWQLLQRSWWHLSDQSAHHQSAKSPSVDADYQALLRA